MLCQWPVCFAVSMAEPTIVWLSKAGHPRNSGCLKLGNQCQPRMNNPLASVVRVLVPCLVADDRLLGGPQQINKRLTKIIRGSMRVFSLDPYRNLRVWWFTVPVATGIFATGSANVDANTPFFRLPDHHNITTDSTGESSSPVIFRLIFPE